MSTECRRLLFVGVDWRRKGLPDLLEAFAAVRATHGELTLDVIGGVPNEPAPPGVNMIGRVPHSQMPGYFSQSDLLVIPTHAEPFGIALVEALTMGIPVIGTTVGNQEWIIGTGGYTVKPGDTDSLSAAIRRAVDDYPALKAKAELRSDELKETMTWERIAERILSELLNDQVCGP
jgi:glycosyltransferase involved in cell wall biosynthesis